jgi:hypothetical protein
MPPIHVYCSKLWECNFKMYFYNICDNFMAPLLYIMSIDRPTLRLSKEVIETIKDIGDWYMEKHYAYIRIFGCTSAPHLLPKYVPDRLVIREISYKTVDKGITSFLSTHEKNTWSRLSIKVGIFSLLNAPHARKEAMTLKELSLCTGNSRRHDPMGMVEEHIKAIGLAPSYKHDPNTIYVIFQGTMSYEEVLDNIQDNEEQEKNASFLRRKKENG